MRPMRHWAACFCVAVLAGTTVFANTGITANAESVVKELQIKTVDEEGKEKTPEVIAEETLRAAQEIPTETNELKNWPEGPKINGESAIVMDVESGAVLFGKAVDDPHYPASITKVLTALVALENSKMTDIVTFSQESIDCQHGGYAHIGMRKGEEITMNDALHALLLASANEVAYAIGEKVGGTHEKFVQMMNDKAKELGCENSNFVNTNGEFEEDHYTSARDMALIAAAAYEIPEFREIIKTREYRIAPTNMINEERVFQQKHRMAVAGKYYDERCTGGKTGFTDEAHNTLVTYMEENGLKLVCVDLKSRKETYENTRSMFDYAFKNFEKVPVNGEKAKKDGGDTSKDGYVLLPQGIAKSQLTHKTDAKNGLVQYFYEDNPVGAVKAAAAALKGKNGAKADKGASEKEKKGIGLHLKLKWWQVTLAVAAVLVVALIIFVNVALYRKRKRRRERMRRRRQMERRRMQKMQEEAEAEERPKRSEKTAVRAARAARAERPDRLEKPDRDTLRFMESAVEVRKKGNWKRKK